MSVVVAENNKVNVLIFTRTYRQWQRSSGIDRRGFNPFALINGCCKINPRGALRDAIDDGDAHGMLSNQTDSAFNLEKSS